MSSGSFHLPPGHPDAPKESSVHIVAAELLDSVPVSAALHYWKSLKGVRRFPAREELTPRRMAPFLRNIVLLRIIDDGADYEYRIVGDAHVQAQGLNFQGMRLSEVEAIAPEPGKLSRATYGHVRVTREPFAVRGWVGRDVPASKYCYYETAFLPLGKNDVMDHILVATSYAPRAGVADLDKSRKMARV
jgi:hypothetical protein